MGSIRAPLPLSLLALAGILLLVPGPTGCASAATGTWAAMEYPVPFTGRGVAAAFDAAHHRLYRYGGSDGRAFSTGTWTLDLGGTGAWSPIRTSGPVPDATDEFTLVHDSARDRLLLFGGRAGDGSALAGVWVLPLAGTAQWARLEVAGIAPAGRWGHAAIYDASRDRMVVAGGRDAGRTLGDAWALSLGGVPAWTPLAPGTLVPDARQGSALACDPAAGVAWAFGGRDAAGRPLGDLWRFGPDSTGWTPVALSGDLPPALGDHTLVLDAGRSRLLLFGGRTLAGPATNDAWAISTLDGTVTKLAPGGEAPAPRFGHASVFDPAGDAMIVIGGSGPGETDAWRLSGDGSTWTRLAPGGVAPGTLVSASAVLDPAAHRVLLWGGKGEHGASAATWALSLDDPPAWSEIVPAGEAPAARWAHVAGFDPVGRSMLVAGGTSGGTVSLRDAWALDLAGAPAWRRLATGGAAPARRAAAGAWSADRGRLLVFAGVDSGATAPRAELFAADTAAWDTLSPRAGQPVPRSGHSLIQDPIADGVVLFGGRGADGALLDDAWALSLAGGAWIPLTGTGPSPAPREGHSAIYDPAGGRMLLFGGAGGSGRFADLWSLRLESPGPELPVGEWTALPVPGGPSARARHAAGWDSTRMVLLGGSSGDTLRDDAWALDLGAPAWSPLVTAATGPPRQTMPTATLDPVRHRLIVLGNSTDPYRANVWELSLAGAPEWKPLAAEGDPPSPRCGHTAVYDAGRDRIVYFGGSWWNTVTTMNDVWALNLSPAPRWEQLLPAGTAPEPRMGHAAVYDPVRDRMIVHGGYHEAGSIWALKGQYALVFADSLRWEPLVTADSSFLDRNFHTLTYDPVRDRVLAFGGCELDTYGSVYELTFGDSLRWTKLLDAGAGPASRRSHSTVYDPVRDRLLVYGGDTDRFWGPGGTHLSDVWALDLPSMTWAQVDMGAGPLPGKRCEQNAVWDGALGRMVMFGGNDSGPDLNDLWQATWDGAPPADVPPAAPPAAALAIRSVRPNPLAGRATVALALPGAGPALLEVFDPSGRRVLRQEIAAGSPGPRTIQLDARGRLGPGLYLLRLAQDGRAAGGRIVVLE